jgi:hypothetical protein
MRKLAITLLIFGCSAETVPTHHGSVDTSILIIDAMVPLDVRALEWGADSGPTPDAGLDPCETPDISNHESYCACFPDCCDYQNWYCPPNPLQTIESMRVTLEICDEDKQPCIFGHDEDCPPPEIIHRSECVLAYECPPGSTRDFLQWFECQLDDGRMGRQRVLCDKGVIIHGPCIVCTVEECNTIDDDCDDRIDEGFYPCENECGPGQGVCVNGMTEQCNSPQPEEEVCDFEDNDCDGQVDEDQRNACDACGLVPPEICDGADNDCDGSIDEDQIRECETVCGRGVDSCIGGRWASCTARQPVDEICDGFDNDCDGIPDEGLNCLCSIDQVGALFPCAEGPMVCGMGFKTCECLDVDCNLLQMGQCRALCDHLPPVVDQECDADRGTPIEQELCNNFDEDCDASIDEDLAQACYTGPRGTLNVGICIPGEQTCVEGRWGSPNPIGLWTQDLCGDEVTPNAEICNGADDNCDGEIDYGEEMRDTDILFIVDGSGSMTADIRAVMSALNRFSLHFADERAIRWGMILGPTRTPDPAHPGSELEMLTLISNILPFEHFLNNFAGLDPAAMDGGLEMLMDAVVLAVRNLSPLVVDLANSRWRPGVVSIPDLQNFMVDWRANTDRIIIVFSDETDQSYMMPRNGRDEVTAALAAAARTKMYTFALAFYGWDEMAIASGGRNFNLSPDAAQMYNDLMSIIDEICLPRANGPQAMSPRYPLPPRGYLPASAMMCY